MPGNNLTLPETGPAEVQPVQPNLWEILKVWLKIGVQSFGGGSSTNLLIRNEFIYKRGWLSEEEHLRFWVLCQLVPGINLIALTILIGKKLGGAAGIALSLAGMLLPSAGITTLLAVGFSVIQGWSPIQAMLKGLTPATAGISLVVAVQFANPLFRRAKKEGPIPVALSFFIIGGGAFAVTFFKLPVVSIFIGGAIIGGLAFGSGFLNRPKKNIS
jgi:chromate transporter